MPPVRILPATDTGTTPAAAPSADAGSRFRRLLDRQSTRTAAPALPSFCASIGASIGASLGASLGTSPDAMAGPRADASPRAMDAGDGTTDGASRRDPYCATEGVPCGVPNGVPYGVPHGVPHGGPTARSAPAASDAAPTLAPTAAQPAPAQPSLVRTSQAPRPAQAAFAPVAPRRDDREMSQPKPAVQPDNAAQDRNARTFPPAFVTQLERDVGAFCGAGELAADGPARTVTLTPDPRVLPETRLTMTISPDALSLRFHSESARSRELLCLHGDTLKSRLAGRTGRTVEIEIESDIESDNA